MKIFESEIEAKDGLKLFCKSIHNDSGTAEKHAVVVHGFGEHSGRYGNVIEPLLKDGFGVHLMDTRGHGKSEGKRGHVLRYDEYIEDLDLFFDKLEREKGIRKAHLIGHSQGGLIVLKYAIMKPEALLTVSASGSLLRLKVKVPIYKEIPGKLFSKLIPGFSMPNGLLASDLSHDPAVVKAYEDDPLVHDLASARWFTEMVGASAWTLAHAPDLKVPALIMHGSDDRLTDHTGSEEFYKNAGARDKELKIYEGMFHEIFNEIGKEKPLGDLRDWLKKH